MYKLCIALAFLAVAAAKPNWPLAYSGIEEYGYPAGAVYQPAAVYHGAAAYPAYYGSNYGYSAPLIKAAPVVAKTYTAPVVAAAAPVVAAPAHVVAAPAPLAYSAEVAAPLAYSASIAPLTYSASIAPLTYSASIAPVAYHGYPYDAPVSYIAKKK